MRDFLQPEAKLRGQASCLPGPGVYRFVHTRLERFNIRFCSHCFFLRYVMNQ